jgi:hypothetical protein
MYRSHDLPALLFYDEIRWQKNNLDRNYDLPAVIWISGTKAYIAYNGKRN